MRERARSLHQAQYSTDASINIQMLSTEEKINKSIFHANVAEGSQFSRESLLRLWSWITCVEENLCSKRDVDHATSENFHPARGLIDAGTLKLLQMEQVESGDRAIVDTCSNAPSLNCEMFDSPVRRVALTACGWIGKFGLRESFEAEIQFERSAALAVWHGDLGKGVDALQHGADDVRMHIVNGKKGKYFSQQYAETLELVAMCVAGYSGRNCKDTPSSAIWRRACDNLLNRPDISNTNASEGGIRASYLRAICTFLVNVGEGNSLQATLHDQMLSLSDRVAFACLFLPRKELRMYLESCIATCTRSGNLEGIVVTGLDKRGIAILQSYVDKCSDVQTAALISSRVILPVGWVSERAVCSEWLYTYREMLNTWQMWQSRAIFDVGRAELLREIRDKQHADDLALLLQILPDHFHGCAT